jgi:hypothetical protein
VRASDTVEITGHLIDSGNLSRILDDIAEYGGDYSIDRFEVGHDSGDPSHAVITVFADDDALQRLLMRLQTHGTNPVKSPVVNAPSKPSPASATPAIPGLSWDHNWLPMDVSPPAEP